VRTEGHHVGSALRLCARHPDGVRRDASMDTQSGNGARLDDSAWDYRPGYCMAHGATRDGSADGCQVDGATCRLDHQQHASAEESEAAAGATDAASDTATTQGEGQHTSEDTTRIGGRHDDSTCKTTHCVLPVGEKGMQQQQQW